jgi:hypothetical protein
VTNGAEVLPVDIETFAGAGIHANVSATCGRTLAHRLEIVFEDRDATGVAECLQPLRQDRSGGGRT